MNFRINNLNWEIDLASDANISIVDKIKDNKKPKSFTNPVPAEDLDPCGLTYRSKLHIFINDSLNDDLFERTLIHELTHAYIWSYGMTQFENFNEEQVCDFMETHGESIFKLKDNLLIPLLEQKRERENCYSIINQ